MARVLIVDDSKTERELVGKVVSASGHTCTFAVDGVDAVNQAKATLPDLILMDVVMPNLNGFNAVRILKGDPATAQIPIVLVTLKNSEGDQLWGKKIGAAAHVGKPFTPEGLARVVDENIAQR